MKQQIKTVYFTDNTINIETMDGEILSQPLEAFPALLFASPEQRENYYLWADNASIRWEKLDEDIHISNFLVPIKVNYDNELNKLLLRLPWLDMKELAEYLGMHWTKLAKFRYGVWTPSSETRQKIKLGIKAVGREIIAAVS